MIRKNGSQYQVLSETGKNMGVFKTEGEAKKRLAMIEYFKHLHKLGKK